MVIEVLGGGVENCSDIVGLQLGLFLFVLFESKNIIEEELEPAVEETVDARRGEKRCLGVGVYVEAVEKCLHNSIALCNGLCIVLNVILCRLQLYALYVVEVAAQ